MEDNPQKQILIVAMLFWIIILISIFSTAVLEFPLNAKGAVIVSAILGILIIEFSIKKRPLGYKDRVLAGLAMTAITLIQFPNYMMPAFYSQADPFVNLMRPVVVGIIFGMPILLLAILIASFLLYVKKYSLKQNIQSAGTLLLAAFFFIFPIFMSMVFTMMGPY